MANSVVAGIIVCGALAICTGRANAHVREAPVHMTRTASTLSSLKIKGGPLHDCVHITFPQCGDRGFNGPND
jgi:hypothetical protein